MINPVHGLRYAGFIAWEVFTGALTVAGDALTPGKGTTPMILELPLQCDTDFEITVMASSITITPGTITIGITPRSGPSPATLFVHSMYTADRQQALAELHDMERRLLLMTRGPGDRS